jgi:hypothetical protein
MPLALSDAERATRALVKVAGTCRGFVVANPGGKRFVLTAAHCLRRIPLLDLKLKTLDKLVTSGRRRVTIECRFADPVADIAVLSPTLVPKALMVPKSLISDAEPLSVASPPDGRFTAWLPSLDMEWFPVDVLGGDLGITIMGWPLDKEIEPGMSGSPILNNVGAAVGIVVLVGRMPPLWEPALTPQRLPGAVWRDLTGSDAVWR